MEDESPKVNVVPELTETRIELVEQPSPDESDRAEEKQPTASASCVLVRRFHLIDEIGSGAWSKVYSAKDTRLNNKPSMTASRRELSWISHYGGWRVISLISSKCMKAKSMQ